MNTVLPIEESPVVKQYHNGFALFRLGFRPFFLLGPIFSVLALGYFVLWMSGGADVWPSAWDALIWHRHEMLFGYTGAIIAGFLLTAVPNWTGHPTPKGKALALIVGLWLAGRMAVLFSSYLSPVLVMAIDCSFFLACAAAIAPALMKSKNQRNYFFIALLLGLFVANLLTHFYTDENTEMASLGIRIGLSIIILIMVILGGRVIPFFTERPLGIAISRSPQVEKITIIASVIALTADIADINAALCGGAFLIAAIANGWRMSQWQSLKTLKVPLLWVLHVGYAWIVVGMTIKGLSLLEMNVPPIAATHAFTAGAIGMLTLGMMARVSLGHSGRPLEVGKSMTIAFFCVNLAALFRVFGVWLFPVLTMRWFEAAALCWVLGFGIFIVIYTPILVRPRLDGRDG